MHRPDRRNATIDEEEDPHHRHCPQNINIKWSTEVGLSSTGRSCLEDPRSHCFIPSQASSSVFGTPIITDLFSDGIKDILVPSFVHYLDALEGPTGANAPGFPADHHERVHASPLMYDIDNDGVKDILLATYNGELLWFKDDGTQRYSYYSLIPRLRVRKDWHKGLHDDPNNRPEEGGQHAQQQVPPPPPHDLSGSSTGRRLLQAEASHQQPENTRENRLTKEGEDSFQVFQEHDIGAEEEEGGAAKGGIYRDPDLEGDM